MANQQKNLRFLKNEDFALTSIEMLQNLGRTIIETDNFYVPDELRLSFQESKNEILDSIAKACLSIKSMITYKNDYENGEYNA